jgi:uncharacterized protein YndB with AHSA1/START domain
MFDQDFATTFVASQPADVVFDAINDVRGWWGEGVDGSNAAVGDEFTYRVDGVHYSKIEVVELVPNERIVWRVLENHLSFVEDQNEWVGTTITFQIDAKDDGTQVRFEHKGLVPAYECFEVCSSAWASLIHGSLRNLISTGTGQPYARALSGAR